jgi:sugar lactone lactonase YvrE
MYIIIKDNNLLGESCFWSKYENKFYWVDILGKKIKSYDGNLVKEFETNKMPCCIVQQESNKLLLALEDEIGIYDFRTNRFYSELKIDGSKVRFNDGKLDNNGILHIGTMDREEKNKIGSIYKYNSGYLEPIINDIGISNGIAFDHNNTMYWSDSLDGRLYWNNQLINQYIDVGPDGGYVDFDNKYYSCLWGGSCIDIYKNQSKYNKIILPVKYPTCCCYGGIDMNKLFITSASILDNSESNGKCVLF